MILAALVVGAARLAHAAPKVPTRLVWDGAACGSVEEFEARVVRRSRAVRFVASGERIAVRAAIARGEAGLDASVRIEAPGSAPITRRIRSSDCDDALDALALVVAISVEGHAATSVRPSTRRTRRPAPPRRPDPRPPEPPPSEPAPPLPPPSAPEEAAGGASPPPAAAPEPSAPPAPEPPAPEPEPPVRAPLPEQSRPRSPAPEPSDARADERIVLGAGLAAQLSVGVAPEPLLGGALWLSAAWERQGIWSPEVSLSALHQRLDGSEQERGAADFMLNALTLSLCPLRLGSTALELRPCAAGSVGQLDAEGHETYAARSDARPWGSLGGNLALVARIGIVELRALLGAAAPFVRDSFGFGSACSGAACEADVFHRVAPVIWSGSFGVGLSPR